MLHAFYLSVLQNNAVLWEENSISETENSLKSYLGDTFCLEVTAKLTAGQVELHLGQKCFSQYLQSLK